MQKGGDNMKFKLDKQKSANIIAGISLITISASVITLGVSSYMLNKEINELAINVDQLEERVDELSKRIEKLEKRIQHLDTAINEVEKQASTINRNIYLLITTDSDERKNIHFLVIHSKDEDVYNLVDLKNSQTMIKVDPGKDSYYYLDLETKFTTKLKEDTEVYELSDYLNHHGYSDLNKEQYTLSDIQDLDYFLNNEDVTLTR